MIGSHNDVMQDIEKLSRLVELSGRVQLPEWVHQLRNEERIQSSARAQHNCSRKPRTAPIIARMNHGPSPI